MFTKVVQIKSLQEVNVAGMNRSSSSPDLNSMEISMTSWSVELDLAAQINFFNATFMIYSCRIPMYADFIVDIADDKFLQRTHHEYPENQHDLRIYLRVFLYLAIAFYIFKNSIDVSLANCRKFNKVSFTFPQWNRYSRWSVYRLEVIS